MKSTFEIFKSVSRDIIDSNGLHVLLNNLSEPLLVEFAGSYPQELEELLMDPTVTLVIDAAEHRLWAEEVVPILEKGLLRVYKVPFGMLYNKCFNYYQLIFDLFRNNYTPPITQYVSEFQKCLILTSLHVSTELKFEFLRFWEVFIRRTRRIFDTPSASEFASSIPNYYHDDIKNILEKLLEEIIKLS